MLTLGEALVAVVPTSPATFDAATRLELFVGGAEVNFAVGVRRLGVASCWAGRVGDDSLGRLVLARLLAEGVDVSRVLVDSRPTGIYLREWLPDGERRPYYYRRGSAGGALAPGDVVLDEATVTWLHLTGITPALGDVARAAFEGAIDRATELGIPVSFDANYRSALWTSDEYVARITPLLSRFAVLLLGEEEAELLLGTRSPRAALERAVDLGVAVPVVRQGERGAAALDEEGRYVTASAPARAIDPVGAGDAFDAGFVATMLRGGSVEACLSVGACCGARAVEVVGEYTGAPTLADLPPELARHLRADSPGARRRSRSRPRADGAR